MCCGIWGVGLAARRVVESMCMRKVFFVVQRCNIVLSNGQIKGWGRQTVDSYSTLAPIQTADLGTKWKPFVTLSSWSRNNQFCTVVISKRITIFYHKKNNDRYDPFWLDGSLLKYLRKFVKWFKIFLVYLKVWRTRKIMRGKKAEFS